MPLSGIRVVEIAGLPAAAYAARLLADFGAEVIKVEPTGGDPERQRLPLIGAHSAWFTYLNYGKKSVAAASPDGLIADADVLIVSGDAAGDVKGDHPAGQIVARVDWFGPGPYRGYVCTDSVCRALAGAIHLTGPTEGPPLALPDFQSGIIGGLATFIPVMAALMARGATGGRTIDVSIHEATIALSEYQAVEMQAGIVPRRRWGLNRFSPTYPLGIYPCREGWLGVTIVTPAQWKSFCDLLGMPDLGRHPDWVMGPERLPKADALEARFRPRLLERTAAEWFALGLENRLPFAIVPDMGELLSMPVFRERGAIVPIDFGDRTVEAPGTPFHLTVTPAHHGGAVPRVGQHTDDYLPPEGEGAPKGRMGDVGAASVSPGDSASVAASPFRRFAPSSPSGGRVSVLPLTGMRIIDLSMGWAGPTVTRHLADMGADIVKVEACGYPDWWRGVDNRAAVVEQLLYEKTLRFNIMNRNKRAITLDLTTPDGANLLKELVRGADALVENYSADVLPKLGLDYQHLREVNPSLVMMSMTAFGARGAWRDCRAYGSTLEHGSGLPSLNGRAGDPPVKNHLAYGDPVGGMNGVSALLVALLHRQRTGVGQYIDLSQVQCMTPFTAVWALLQSCHGNSGPKRGNRHPEFAPHGIFPCAGEDNWILLTATDDAMWQALCRTIERPDLAAQMSFVTVEGRRRNEDRIEEAIAAWTRGRDANAAMRDLQTAGIAAGVVRAPGELFDDPQLATRGFWQWVERAHIGRHPQPSPPYRFDESPLPVRWPAATLGQYNTVVLRELLGLSTAELARLEASGVIGTRAVPPSQRKARASAL